MTSSRLSPAHEDRMRWIGLRRVRASIGVWACAGLLVALAWPQRDAKADDAGLSLAQRLYRTGKYAEAGEQFEKLREGAPVPAALGLARCQVATGKSQKAEETLR